MALLLGDWRSMLEAFRRSTLLIAVSPILFITRMMSPVKAPSINPYRISSLHKNSYSIKDCLSFISSSLCMAVTLPSLSAEAEQSCSCSSGRCIISFGAGLDSNSSVCDVLVLTSSWYDWRYWRCLVFYIQTVTLGLCMGTCIDSC